MFIIFRYFVDEKPIWDNEKLDKISIDNSIPQYTGGIIKVFVYYFLYVLYTFIYPDIIFCYYNNSTHIDVDHYLGIYFGVFIFFLDSLHFLRNMFKYS